MAQFIVLTPVNFANQGTTNVTPIIRNVDEIRAVRNLSTIAEIDFKDGSHMQVKETWDEINQKLGAV